MDPAGLLTISRVCKYLRSIFMSKNVKAIWIAAEKAIGLPPCPSDLSHPQHASLVFDNFCMVSRRSTPQLSVTYTSTRFVWPNVGTQILRCESDYALDVKRRSQFKILSLLDMKSLTPFLF